MEIDSLQLALVVQGVIKGAKERDPLDKQTLEEWNRTNQEDGLPPMEQLLREWVEKNRPKEPEAPKQEKSCEQISDSLDHTKQGELTPDEERELILDAMDLGYYFIVDDGAVKYADFFAEMVNNFGDGIRPYVAQIYFGIYAKVDNDILGQMDTVQTVKSYDINMLVIPPVVMQNLEQFAKLSSQLIKLAYHLVQMGVRTLDGYYNIANQAVGKVAVEKLKASKDWVDEWIKSIWEENYTDPESGNTKKISEWAMETDEADASSQNPINETMAQMYYWVEGTLPALTLTDHSGILTMDDLKANLEVAEELSKELKGPRWVTVNDLLYGATKAAQTIRELVGQPLTEYAELEVADLKKERDLTLEGIAMEMSAIHED